MFSITNLVSRTDGAFTTAVQAAPHFGNPSPLLGGEGESGKYLTLGGESIQYINT